MSSNKIRYVFYDSPALQNGFGVPDHIGPLGSLYVDYNDGVLYVNKNGITNWTKIGENSFTGSTYVPYTGATTNVDLGNFDINTKGIKVTGVNGNGHLTMRWQASDPSSQGNHTTFFADSLGNFKWKNDGGFYSTLKSNTNTSDRIYTFPNRDITFDNITTSSTTTSIGFIKGNGSNVTFDNSSYYLSSNPSGFTNNLGTVTSVSNLTIGTSGSDINSSIVNSATTPTITLNIPTASASTRGVLSSSDWRIFNSNVLISDGLPGIALTGGTTLTRTIIKSYTIPANTFSAGDTFEVWAVGSKVNANSSWYVNIVFNSTEIARVFSNTATVRYMPIQRIFSFNVGGVLHSATNNSGTVTETSLTSAASVNTFDTTVANSISIGVQPVTGGTADIFNIEKVIIRKMQYKITV